MDEEKNIEKTVFHNIKAIKATPYVEIPWLVQNFILKAGIHMLVGSPASTKSLLTLLIALEGVTKQIVLGKFKVNEKLRVLILDKENSLIRFVVRFKLLENGHEIGFDIENDYFVYSDFDGFILDGEKGNKELLFERIKQDNINLVVFDSLVRFFKADENNSKESDKIKQIFNEIIQLGCSVWFLHHLNKSGNYRGSSDIQAFCDIVYVIERDKNIFTLTNNVEKGGKVRDKENINSLSYEIESEEINEKTTLLRLKYITAKVSDKIEIKTPMNTNKNNKRTKYDKLIVTEIVKITKKYITENNLDVLYTKDLINYLTTLYNDADVVKDNLYYSDGALQMMIKENFLLPSEKTEGGKSDGKYKVVK